jgi:tetratricopeptide (TPR) repeat protein
MGMLLTYAIDQGVTTDQHVLARAEEYAERALALNPASAPALCVRGAVSFKRGRIEDAISFLRRSLASDPNNVDALNFQVVSLLCVGEIEEARLLAHRLVALDPLTPVNHALPGLVERFAGDMRAALAGYRMWYEMDPRNAFAAVCLAFVHWRIGETDAARRTLAPVVEAPSGLWTDFARFFDAAFRDDRARAVESLTAEMLSFAETEPVYAHWLAMAFAMLRDRDLTLTWLRQALRRGFCHADYVRRVDPAYAFLRADADFRATVEAMDQRRRAVEEGAAAARA